MKFHPPTPEIPADDPFKNDLFSRKELGDSLLSLFKATQESVVLCLDAPWGDGKTTFARMWLAELKRQGLNCIYFNAYAHDYADEPFIAFCGEILSLAEKSFADDAAIQALKKDFKSKAKKIGAKLLGTSARIGAKALTLGILKDSDIDAIDSLRTDIADAASSKLSSFMDKVLEDYVSSKQTLDDFRSKLSALGKAVRDKQGFPLLIVVDELDRCRPDFALSLIEQIKHLFAAQDVSFILLANTAQLQNYAKALYGAEVDAANYLRKFFTLTVNLPCDRISGNQNDYWKYSRRLSEHYEIKGQYDLALLTALFRHYGVSLREMENCFSILAIYYAQLPKNRITCPLTIPLLAVLRLKEPDIFGRLARKQMTYEGLIQATHIDLLNASEFTGSSREVFLDRLMYLLCSDQQINLKNDSKDISYQAKWLASYNISRDSVIPYFCAELTRFKMELPPS